eukprot:TRINITY_DN7860_c0_g1_i1.p1 TRINITY_DN7860_c0_g1~~TRINITY_DN7860_c0_g1_i1.p1  ORF type:complete len:250 (-),score=34.41 TRINITY_DN7860_c0_g1_i1:95-844(-)
MRAFELDAHFNHKTHSILCYHLKIFDTFTHCFCLEDCLREIKIWSDDNPGHHPITVFFEFKLDWYENEASSGITATQLILVENLVKSVFDMKDVIIPDDIRGNYTTLRESINDRGWPLLAECKKKIIFVVLNTDFVRDLYAQISSPPMKNRLMFLMHDDNSNAMDGIFDSENHPKRNPDTMKRLLDELRMVRCWVNGVGDDPVETLYAFNSSTQMIVMDLEPKETWRSYTNNVTICGSKFYCNPNELLE